MSRVIASAALVCFAMGCTHYRPAPPLPAPTAAVRVSFLTPQDLVARTSGGDTVVLAGVTALSGNIVRDRFDTRTDSLRVRVDSAHSGSGRITGIPEGVVVAVPRASLERIEQKTLDPRRTTIAAGMTALIALYVLAFWASRVLDDTP